MWIQKEVYPKETLKLINIDYRDLAGSMQEEIEMPLRVMGKIELAVRTERIQQAEDMVAEIEDDIDDQPRDPTYVEETNSEAKEARDPSYTVDTDIESDVSEQIPFPPPSGPRSKLNGPSKQKNHRSEKRPSEDSAGSTDTALKKARPDNTTKQSHHSGKEDGNFKRHLKSHARKGHIENQEVDKTFLVTLHQESTRGQARKTTKCVLTGLPFKWCPVNDCEVVTHLMRSHLRHNHRLKPGPLLENYLHVV